MVENGEREQTALPDPGAFLFESWVLFKDKFWPLAVIGGVGAAASLASAVLPFLAALLLTLIFPGSYAVWILAALAAASGVLWFVSWAQVAMFEEVLSPSRLPVMEAYRTSAAKIVPFTWVCLLAFIFVMGGFFLFVIPGVYLAIGLLFAPLVCVDEGVGGMDAMVRSLDCVRGRWLPILGRLMLLGLASYLVSSLPLIGPLLGMVTGPFTFAGAAVLYRRAKGLMPAAAPLPAAKAKLLLAATALGFLLPLWGTVQTLSLLGPALRAETANLAEHPLDPALGMRLVKILQGGASLESASQAYDLIESSGTAAAPQP